jgi:hypothetical protein
MGLRLSVQGYIEGHTPRQYRQALKIISPSVCMINFMWSHMILMVIRKSRQRSLFYRTHSSPLVLLAPFKSCGAADTVSDNPDRLQVLMDWLKRIFTGKSADDIAARNRRKRQGKTHSQRVRAREKELRLAQDGGGAKSARLFWGPPGETYSNEKRGKRPKELPTSGLMRTSH